MEQIIIALYQLLPRPQDSLLVLLNNSADNRRQQRAKTKTQLGRVSSSVCLLSTLF